MDIQRITKIKFTAPEYREIIDIYNNAFPKSERIAPWMLRLLSHKKNFHWLAFYDDNRLCGFAYFTLNDTTIYLLYFAVNSRIRSKGYGSRILSWIKENYPGREMLLDVEKLDENAQNYKQRLKRIDFYRNNGIYQTGCFIEDRQVTYEILSTNKTFDKKRFNANMRSLFQIFG